MRPILPLACLVPSLALAQPLRVTSDSIAHCLVLQERLAAAPAAARGTPARLADEGRQLCETGHPRTGVAKLRRALRLALAEAE